MGIEPAIQDLNVTVHDSSLVFPDFQVDETKSLFFSNIDQVLNFHVQTLHFFPPNPDFTPEAAAERLKSALQKVMVEYEFLAGRVKPDQETGRLEVQYKPYGAGFVVASSEFSLDEIGDLVYPNPAFMQLILPGLSKFDDNPLCVLQVTSFKCGGFCLGVSTNHALFDGMSFKVFLQNLGSQAFSDRPFHVIPCHDRLLLAARTPPQVTFDHPELLKQPEGAENATVFDCNQEELDFKIFRLSSEDINRMKETAKSTKTKPNTKLTGFNLITAHVWRCKALSRDVENNRERESIVLYAVDIKPRMNPPLPASYCGNAVLSAYAAAKCWELEVEPLAKLVERITEGAARITDEYARSAIDWGEIHKGFPNGEFLISSWWRLGFDEVEYPWGKPKYSCPVVYRRSDIILLFPDIGGATSQGVNVLVALPPKEMIKFQSLFSSLLE